MGINCSLDKVNAKFKQKSYFLFCNFSIHNDKMGDNQD